MTGADEPTPAALLLSGAAMQMTPATCRGDRSTAQQRPAPHKHMAQCRVVVQLRHGRGHT